MNLSQRHNHHKPVSGTKRLITIALVLNFVLLIVETITGFTTGSLALLSDAAHMLSDVAALSIALLAAHFADKPNSLKRSFGFSSAEALGAFANTIALFVACFIIFSEAVERLITGVPPVEGGTVLIVGVIGLLVNLGSAWFLHKGDSESLNVRGAVAHMMADALGSVGAIAAAICMMLGYSIADPIISIVIGTIILWNAYVLGKDCIGVLLGFAPKNIDPAKVKEVILAVPGIQEVHDLHLWAMDGRLPLLTVHVVTNADRPISVIKAVTEVLRSNFSIEHSTIQVEDCPEDECEEDCILC